MGKETMEAHIHVEIRKLVELLREDLGQETCLKHKMNIPILNSLWTLITGEKMEYDDPKLITIIKKIDKMMTSVASVGPINLFSWLKYIAPDLSNYSTIMESSRGVYDMVEEQYQDHVKTFQADSPRDLMDVFIAEMKEARDPNSAFFGEKGRKNLDVTVGDLFTAGSDTTTLTLNWLIYYLSLHPEIQVRAQAELDTVVGRSRLAQLKDRPNMPYMEAIVQEVNRMAALGYTGVPRATTKDTQIGGYDIPAGTQVWVFLYHILRDPSYWTDADTFNPDRFLEPSNPADPKSKPQVRQDPRSVPFGMGKRMCLGRTLAMSELFLFGCALFQNFRFELTESEKGKRMDHIPGFVLGCPKYNVVIHER